jgi:AraC-like DNA-binding protein
MDPTVSAKVLRFSTDDYPQAKRIAMYQEIYGRTIVRHDIEPIGDDPFHFRATLCSMPGLAIASSVISPCRRWHRAQHIDSDGFVLGIGLSGGCMVEQSGREATVAPGEAVLTSMADPADVTIALSRPLSLRIPNAVLRSKRVDLDHWRVRAIPRGPAGLLLTGYLEALWNAEALLKLDLRDAVVSHVHDLICLMLGAEGDARELAERRGVRAARLSAVLRAIESRGGDPGLSASAVAVGLGVTARYVHRLLEETGKSFSHHVLERRLENAATLLRDPRWRERRIADVALEAGFTDLSHFSRVFRRRYGATPSDVRKSN